MKKSPWELTVGEFWERAWRPLKDTPPDDKVSPAIGYRPSEKGPPRTIDSGAERVALSLALRSRKNGEGHDLRAAAALFEEATGEAPHEVVALTRGYLFETGLLGDYDQCPNGYLPLYVYHTPRGWIVFATRHCAPGNETVPKPLLRDREVLYMEAGADPGEVRFAIGTMVRILRGLTEGR